MFKRLSMMVIFIFLFLEMCVFPVHAEILGFDTYDLSAEEKADIIQTTNLKVIQDDSHKEGIRCFDVNRDGSYALAMGTGSNCRVYVYDPNGAFLYGYRFYCDGDYAIGFHEDALAIYSLRGNTIALYDAAGTCTGVQRAADTSVNDVRISGILNRTSMDMGDRRYMLERDMDMGDSYSRLVSVSQSGEKAVLYDISSEHSLRQSIFIIAVVGFFLFVIIGICRKRIK